MENLIKIKNLITNTPIVDITYEYRKKRNHIYAKCEWFSLTGSVKDKVAYQILSDAYKNKKIKKGDPIVEVSSGNMGLAITAIANLLGNPVTILMPKNMSEERKKLLKLYGANLVETENFTEAFALCDKYKSMGYFCTSQFENTSNSKAHHLMTAKEIFNKIRDKNVDHFVSGIGTSGTLIGIGSYLKQNMKIKVVSIEPENARIITSKPPYGKHKLQGLSDEILPKLYNKDICDKVIQISDEDAIAISQKLCRDLSLGVGISSGANICGCILSGGNSITILPDDNKKYLSTDLTNPIQTQLAKDVKFLDLNIL